MRLLAPNGSRACQSPRMATLLPRGTISGRQRTAPRAIRLYLAIAYGDANPPTMVPPGSRTRRYRTLLVRFLISPIRALWQPTRATTIMDPQCPTCTCTHGWMGAYPSTEFRSRMLSLIENQARRGRQLQVPHRRPRVRREWSPRRDFDRPHTRDRKA
jgi:hypothetical protein